MAVQVWIGEKPEHPNERRAIVALANGLERLEGLYLLLVNFTVGGRTVDMAVIKRDAIFIVELKHCDGILEGGVNGPWYLTNANGERKQLNPGRSNPYNQVISCYYSMTNFLNEHRAKFLSEHRSKTVNFRSCRRVVVVAPTIDPRSKLDLDWKVETKGLDELPAFLVTERSAEIDLSEEEMLGIPKVLRCTRWKDVNVLMAGVLPQWNAEATAQSNSVTGEVAQDKQVQDNVARTSRFSPSAVRAALRTVTGRVALALSVLVLVLLLVIAVLTPAALPAPRDAQSAQNMAPLVYATSGPAGGLYGGGRREERRCIWTEFQPVGKRWDTQAQQWISVGVDGIVKELAPEIVITLEKVDYCDEHIEFFWSVRNNSERAVTFPLQSNNVTIRDPLGNMYKIADSQSQPRILHVAPGEQEKGTMVVPESPVPNAPSLLVRLREKPFGEASWLVSLEGN